MNALQLQLGCPCTPSALGATGPTDPNILATYNLPTNINSITSGKTTLIDSINNILSTTKNVVSSATPIVQQGKSLLDLFKNKPTTTVANASMSTNAPATNQGGMSTGFKIGVGVAVAAVVAAVVIKAHRSSKKKTANK